MTDRYLVTGGQGFVGRFVVAQLLLSRPDARVLAVGRSPESTGYFTHTMDRGGDPSPAPLPVSLPSSLFEDDRYAYARADLSSATALDELLERFSPTRVIHLASGLWGDATSKLFRCNVEGTVNLLEALARRANTPERIVLGSSGGVYGEVSELPIHEDAPAAPIHMYSVSKLAAELAAKVVAKQADLPLVVARIFNVVGPGQDERHVCGRWMNRLTEISCDPGASTIQRLDVGNLTTTRDFIDVRDTAAACVLLTELGVNGETYNVGTGRETMMRDLLSVCLEVSGLGPGAVEDAERRAADIPRHFADVSKLARLGWSPTIRLKESLQDIRSYYLDQLTSVE